MADLQGAIGGRADVAGTHASGGSAAGTSRDDTGPGTPRRAPQGAARTVEESVSAVLRRQVPVRFGEPPRSWLGGLPMMPAEVAWPTSSSLEHPERGETPLHFVAQIACADLPRELWGGLGPRDGWLLLFLLVPEWDPTENPRAVRVLHVPALGPERTPPAGIEPMRDEAYEGYDFKFYRSQDDIPPTWRRWPLDVVTVPNQPVGDTRFPTITPDDFASILYDGAPVDPRPHTHLPSKMPPGPDEWPYTWPGALYVVDSVIRVLSAKHHSVVMGDKDLQLIESPGWVETSIAAIEGATKTLGERLANLPPADDTTPPAEVQRVANARAGIGERLDELARMKAFLQDGGVAIAPASLVRKMRESQERHDAWRTSRGPALDTMRARILEHDLDSAMSEEEFRPYFEALSADASEFWTIRDDYHAGRRVPTRIRLSLVGLAQRGFSAALAEVAADLYVRSPEHRALIPPQVLAQCEPRWRALHENRPHRMGGLHDGVQSTPEVGPQSRVLLFQMATDYAMQWCWGDAGAHYVFLDVARLAANDFSRIDAQLESH